MSIPASRRCEHLANNECSLLRVKCLEKRFFGGVEICTVRKTKKLSPPPKRIFDDLHIHKRGDVDVSVFTELFPTSKKIFLIWDIPTTPDETYREFTERMVVEYLKGDYIPCIFVNGAGLGYCIGDFLKEKNLPFAYLTLDQLKQISNQHG